MLEASLEILNWTGVWLFESEAQEVVKDTMVMVEDCNRARLLPILVESAIGIAPKKTLYNQNDALVMIIKGHNGYFGPGSDCLHIVDHRDMIRRDPLNSDVADGSIVCDAPENRDFLMSKV